MGWLSCSFAPIALDGGGSALQVKRLPLRVHAFLEELVLSLLCQP